MRCETVNAVRRVVREQLWLPKSYWSHDIDGILMLYAMSAPQVPYPFRVRLIEISRCSNRRASAFRDTPLRTPPGRRTLLTIQGAELFGSPKNTLTSEL